MRGTLPRRSSRTRENEPIVGEREQELEAHSQPRIVQQEKQWEDDKSAEVFAGESEDKFERRSQSGNEEYQQRFDLSQEE